MFDGRWKMENGKQSHQSAVSSQYTVCNRQEAKINLIDKNLNMVNGKWKMENGKGRKVPYNKQRTNDKQRSDIRYPVSGIQYQVSGIRYPISGIRYPVSGIRYPVSRIKLLPILLFFLLYALCSAAFPQSVDSLINEAMLNNPQLKALELRIESAEYRSEGVGYLPPPTIGLEFTQVPLANPDPFNQALSQNLSISQMFMLGGKLSAMNEAEKKNISVAEKEYEVYKLKLILDIKSKYYELWMNEHHWELRDENINLLKSLLESTQNLYTVGRAKYSDLLMLKAELADNETKSKVFENEVSAAVYRMNSLLGRDLENKDLEVYHVWSIDSLKYSPEELEEKLISSNPEIGKMQQMIEMNELELNVNSKERIPDLMLQGMIMRMPRGMFVTSKTPPEMIDGMGKTEYMYGLMASIDLPFAPWSAGKYSAKDNELQSTISGLSSEKFDMQRRLISDLKAMIEKLKSAWEQVNLYSKQVIPLYKQTLDAQLIEYQNSRISINDLINTLEMLIMKEEEEAEFKMNYQMIFSEIENMVGERLTGKFKE